MIELFCVVSNIYEIRNKDKIFQKFKKELVVFFKKKMVPYMSMDDIFVYKYEIRNKSNILYWCRIIYLTVPSTGKLS